MNVIDALVTTLTLDNSGFRRGTTEALNDQQRIRESGRAMANDVGSANRRLADTFRTVRNEAAGLFLALAGANSIKNFIGNIISGDAHVGRLATNLGLATEKVSAWEGAIRRVGGQAGDADALLQSMVSTIQDLKLTGQSSHLADLKGLGVTNMNDPEQMLLQVADASHRMGGQEFAARAGRLGYNEAQIALLAKGRDGVRQLLEEQRRLGVTTEDDAKAAQDFANAWALLQTRIEGAARPSIEWLTGALTGLQSKLDGLDEYSKAFHDTFSQFNWAFFQPIARGFGVVTQAVYELGQIIKQLRAGDISGALNTFIHGAEVPVDGFGNNASVADVRRYFPGYQGGERWRGGSVGAGQRGTFEQISSYLSAHGINADQARGVAAWTMAESAGNTGAFNSAGGGQGAFGIGQWRGSRLRNLRHRYGNNPSLANQLDFLLYELRGGDPGGAAVLRSGGGLDTLRATATYFGRGSASDNAGDIRRGMRFLGDPRMVRPSGGGSPVNVSIGTVVSPNPQAFATSDLPNALRARGLIVQADRGVTP